MNGVQKRLSNHFSVVGALSSKNPFGTPCNRNLPVAELRLHTDVMGDVSSELPLLPVHCQDQMQAAIYVAHICPAVKKGHCLVGDKENTASEC